MQNHNTKTVAWGQEWNRDELQRVMRELLKMMEMFQNLIAVAVTWLHTFTKMHQTVLKMNYFYWVNYTSIKERMKEIPDAKKNWKVGEGASKINLKKITYHPIFLSQKLF